MDFAKRRDLEQQLLEGYVNGPAAATQATARALTKTQDARAIVFVEGISDQIALETAATRLDLDLTADATVILPIGGAHALPRYVRRFREQGKDLRLGGLCDAGEEAVFQRALTEAQIGSPRTRADMEALGFFVCVADLEDEFIRAVGTPAIEALFESQGDLRSFRSLQTQPAWRTRPLEAQMLRYFGSGARRKLRYARLLAEAVELDRLPHPVRAVLEHVRR